MADIGGVPTTNVTLAAMLEVAEDNRTELSAERATAQEAFVDATKESVNPFAAKKKEKEKKLKTRAARVRKGEKAEKKEDVLKEQAEQFEKGNPELNQDSLKNLHGKIKKGAKAQDILEEVQKSYPDVSLADEALDFLLATIPDEELNREVQEAKDQLRSRFERDIIAGRNIQAAAQQAASPGIGEPTKLRDTYRWFVHEKPDAMAQFQELSTKYKHKDMLAVTDFLLHSIGKELKLKGSSISHAELHRLNDETQTLQSILQVYRVFNNADGLIASQLTKESILRPATLTPEKIAENFMQLTAERYPSSGKVLEMADRFGFGSAGAA